MQMQLKYYNIFTVFIKYWCKPLKRKIHKAVEHWEKSSSLTKSDDILHINHTYMVKHALLSTLSSMLILGQKSTPSLQSAYIYVCISLPFIQSKGNNSNNWMEHHFSISWFIAWKHSWLKVFTYW